MNNRVYLDGIPTTIMYSVNVFDQNLFSKILQTIIIPKVRKIIRYVIFFLNLKCTYTIICLKYNCV